MNAEVYLEAVTRKFYMKNIFWKNSKLVACNFFDKRLQHRCFPVNFEKFFRKFVHEHLQILLLTGNLIPNSDKYGIVKLQRGVLRTLSNIENEAFSEKVELLKFLNCFRKKLHLRCLSGFWMTLLLLLPETPGVPPE